MVIREQTAAFRETRTRSAAVSRPVLRRRNRFVAWYRGGGLTVVLFALPVVLIFLYFSWGPIVESVVMSFQRTNFVVTQWVGADNFAALLRDPLVPTAVLNTAWFAVLALLFGYPIPLVVAVLMSEVKRARGLFSALAYLPVVVPPVVSVLLWKIFYDASPRGVFNTILGWVGIPPQPWIQSAITPNQGSNQLSPFVKLATRA